MAVMDFCFVTFHFGHALMCLNNYSKLTLTTIKLTTLIIWPRWDDNCPKDVILERINCIVVQI